MRHAQALDALFHLLLGIKVTNWNVRLATLSSFAMELYHVGRECSYRLVRGAVHFGLGDAKQVLFPVVSANMPMIGDGEYGTVAALLPRSSYALMRHSHAWQLSLGYTHGKIGCSRLPQAAFSAHARCPT